MTILVCTCAGSVAAVAVAASSSPRSQTAVSRSARTSRSHHAVLACSTRTGRSARRAFRHRNSNGCQRGTHRTQTSIQRPQPSTHRTQTSIQRPQPSTHRTQTSIQRPQPSTHRTLPRTHRPPPVPTPKRAKQPAAASVRPATALSVHQIPPQQLPAQQLAATVAEVLATPCPNTELTPEAGNIGLIRSAVLCLINRERAQNGEGPLETSQRLEEAAERHCNELITDDYFAHVSPTGVTPVDRIRTTGYIPGPSVGYVIGENLAWGTFNLATPQAIVDSWIASPDHLANILEGQYRETGIAITPAVPSSMADGAPGATYAQEFGVIIH
jgi:uncharacterized protein YkwD